MDGGVQCPLNIAEVARAVASSPPGPLTEVQLAPRSLGITADEFRGFVRDLDGPTRAWSRTGEPWSLALPLSYVRDHVAADEAGRCSYSAAPPPVDASRIDVDAASANFGDPTVTATDRDTGHTGYPAWLGAFYRRPDGSAVPALLTNAVTSYLRDTSLAPDEATEAAALMLCSDGGIPGCKWPILPVGKPVTTALDLHRQTEIVIAPEGIRVGQTVLWLRCDCRANLRVHGSLDGETLFVRVQQTGGAVVELTDGPVPVICGDSADQFMAIHRREQRDGEILTKDEKRAYVGRLILHAITGGDSKLVFVTWPGGARDDFLVATHANNTLTVTPCRRDPALWRHRVRALDPVGSGPRIRGVYASTAFGHTGGQAVAMLLDGNATLSYTGTMTVAYAIRALIGGLFQRHDRPVAVTLVRKEQWPPHWLRLGALLDLLIGSGVCLLAPHPPGPSELLLFCDRPEYAEYVRKGVVDLHWPWDAVSNYFDYTGPLPLAGPGPATDGDESGAYYIRGYDNDANVSVLVLPNTDLVVGFVLGQCTDHCCVTGLTTEHMIVFLGVVRRPDVECVYASNALLGSDASSPHPGLPLLVDTLVRRGRGVIVDIGHGGLIEPGPEHAFAVRPGIPATAQNTLALATVLDYDGNALRQLYWSREPTTTNPAAAHSS